VIELRHLTMNSVLLITTADREGIQLGVSRVYLPTNANERPGLEVSIVAIPAWNFIRGQDARLQFADIGDVTLDVASEQFADHITDHVASGYFGLLRTSEARRVFKIIRVTTS